MTVTTNTSAVLGVNTANILTSVIGGVPRTQADKNSEYISIADFGVVADGTDQSAKIKAAMVAAILSGKALYIPASPSPYMFKKAQLTIILNNTTMSANRSVCIFGDGAASCLKMMDGEITQSYSTGITFTVQSTVGVNSIYFKDIAIDMNARGSTPPVNDFDYEQSAAIRISTAAGSTIESLVYDNVLINDPAADGFSDAGGGIINDLRYINVKETNRTRTRASIILYQTARNVFIDNPLVARIETEAVAAPTGGYSRCHIHGGSIDLLDLGGFSLSDDLSFLVEKLKVKGELFLGGFDKFLAVNCDFRLNVGGRLNQVNDSKFINCKIRIPYLSLTNTIATLYLVRPTPTRLNVLSFDRCVFEIDYVGALPNGYVATVITNVGGSAISSSNTALNRIIVKDSVFDSRATINFLAYRCGTVELYNNTYAASNGAVHWSTTSTYATDLTVDSGDFALSAIPIRIAGDTPPTNHALKLRGTWLNTGSATWSLLSGALANAVGVISNTRTLPVAGLPTAALQGDTYQLTSANKAIGDVTSHRCITSSTSIPAFFCAAQNGIGSYATVSLPNLSANALGARAIDSTLNTTKTWTGTAWI
jgi:hypothetical protein